MKLMLQRHKDSTSTRPVSYLQVYLQLAINLVALYAFNELSIYIWRALTGH